MNRDDFRVLYGYSDACWRLMDEVLSESPTAWDAVFETTSRWNSIRMLLAHSIGAEERIVTLRLKGKDLPVSYEDRAAAKWSAKYQDHQNARDSANCNLRPAISEHSAPAFRQPHALCVPSRE